MIMKFRDAMVWTSLIALLGVVGCGSRLPVDYPPNPQRVELIRLELGAGAGGAAAAGPELPKPTGWATLTGKFTLVGSAPPAIKLNADKDTATCAPGGMQPTVELVKVDGNGGLADVLLFLNTPVPVDDPLWINPAYDASKTETRPDVFDQKNCLFLSRIYAMQSTQTVIMKNSDNVAHNAKIDPPGGAKSANFTIGANDKGVYEPKGEVGQPFPVSCSIHPWMSAWMISRNNPYFAVTKPDGSFEIKGIPAGEGLKLEFRAWHESPKFLQKVTVDGKPATWSKGKFTLEFKPDETMNINVAIDASVLPK
ncbi:MAG TPA: hypothetical protein VL096_20115 [Pirellulaceae bacterium]|nr:hypothetical protein [Pirellulaceae bacterium]